MNSNLQVGIKKHLNIWVKSVNDNLPKDEMNIH